MANYLVDFKDQVSEAEITSYLEINGCTVLKNFQNLKNVYHISADVTPPLTDIVEIVVLDDDSTVCKLLEVVPVQNTTYNTDASITLADTQNWWKAYSLAEVDLSQETITVPRYGNDTTIYLVDSGIDITHPEFSGKDVELLYSFTSDFTDTTGHGTALASLMIGNTCGLTDSTLKVIKLFDQSYETKQSDILSAFDAIMTDYSNSSSPVAVVNLSWGIQKNSYIEQKIQNLINMGVIVVAAAGNNGTPIEDVTPASMPGVMTIGAYNSNFAPCNFSNYTGPSDTSLTQNAVNHGALDAWAPGENIYCAKILNQSYGYTNGTSAAAAIYSAGIVYNISQGLTNDKDYLPHLRDNNGVVRWNRAVTNRDGLLDLSDPKYSDSTNKICTYDDQQRIYTDHPHNITTPLKIVTKTGNTGNTKLFVNQQTTSYEWLNELPPGAVLINNYLYYSPADEVVDSTGVEVHTVQIKINQTDGSSYTNSIDLVHISADFNAESLPPDDPLIKITAMDTCFASTPLVGCGGRACSNSASYTCCDYKAYCGCALYYCY